MEKFYLTSSYIGYENLSAQPEDELGYDYNEYEDFKMIGDEYDDKSDATPVEIDKLISVLVNFKNKGANYVSCDFHHDHIELDLYGFAIRLSTPEEIKVNDDAILNKEMNERKAQIANLEKKLNLLKNIS
jgi:hypothetical protein|tara:strand:- start:8152 stop:8541 length:390 start_codon:yes stop_codon:yes gene_type:complete